MQATVVWFISTGLRRRVSSPRILPGTRANTRILPGTRAIPSPSTRAISCAERRERPTRCESLYFCFMVCVRRIKERLESDWRKVRGRQLSGGASQLGGRGGHRRSEFYQVLEPREGQPSTNSGCRRGGGVQSARGGEGDFGQSVHSNVDPILFSSSVCKANGRHTEERLVRSA